MRVFNRRADLYAVASTEEAEYGDAEPDGEYLLVASIIGQAVRDLSNKDPFIWRPAARFLFSQHCKDLDGWCDMIHLDANEVRRTAWPIWLEVCERRNPLEIPVFDADRYSTSPDFPPSVST